MTIVQLMKNKLYNKKSEADILDALDNVCNFKAKDDSGPPITLKVKDKEYNYSPTMIAGGCDIFIENWESELIQFMM